MVGRIFSVFLNSYAESTRLKKPYRRLTTRLGWITVVVSLLVLLPAMYYSRMALGLPMESASLEGLRLRMLAWIVFIIVITPFAFYAGMILIYGAFAFVMFVLGRFSLEQAVDFCLRAKYPEPWYRQNP